jgi:hypothetical protein
MVFPLIQVKQIMNPAKYRIGEFLFIWASLFSKTFLNGVVYFFSGRPNSTLDYF